MILSLYWETTQTYLMWIETIGCRPDNQMCVENPSLFQCGTIVVFLCLKLICCLLQNKTVKFPSMYRIQKKIYKQREIIPVMLLSCTFHIQLPILFVFENIRQYP
jgi:hypothetical protein